VYIARQKVVSAASLWYLGLFLALYLGAHLVMRFSVPDADPYLLPLVLLLTAIGVTEIYRINPHDAFRQDLWVVISLALFAAVLLAFRHDYRRWKKAEQA
jgi:cell division protein FtsW (lipid II flippase)